MKVVYYLTQQNKKDIDPIITVDNQLIMREQNIKILGLVMDTNLNWNKHVEQNYYLSQTQDYMP